MKCTKCKTVNNFTAMGHCRECGKHKDRKVLSRNSQRRRNIGGKRGRNSGKVSQHGKKS